MNSTSASSKPSRSKNRSDDAAGPDDRILVGIVHRPHGLRGELKIEILSDVDDRFAPDTRLHLVLPGRADQTVRIVTARRHHGAMLLTLEGIGDREAADSLRGARLEVDAAEVPEPPDGFYYHFQLVGCECHDAREGHLGVVCDVVDDGGGSLLVVEKDGGGRVPIPFVNAFLLEVDLDGRRIDVSLPEGLIETCTSRS
jgi:16S rRNA processing protein RimM